MSSCNRTNENLTHWGYYDLFEEDTEFELIDVNEGSHCRDISQCLKIVADFRNKKVTASEESMLDVIETRIYYSGFASLRVLNEKVSVQYWIPHFANFSPYFEELNPKKSQIVSVGRLGSWKMHEKIRKSSIAERIDKIGPQVLTIEHHLEAAFVVCSLSALVAVITFMCEFFFCRNKASMVHKNCSLQKRTSE